MLSFYWHDYETWGADPSRDWPAQFAGVRTDAELNILDEPLQCFCRPPTDRLPHPEACLVTGITPQQALAEGSAEAARRNLELVSDSYERGVVSIVDLLDAQNAALVSDQVAANAVFDFLIDLMEVQRSAVNFDFFLSAADRAAWFQRLERAFAEPEPTGASAGGNP